SRRASTAHAPDHGRNLDREELHHHLPRAVHDHGARSPGPAENGFGVEVTFGPRAQIDVVAFLQRGFVSPSAPRGPGGSPGHERAKSRRANEPLAVAV